MNKITTFLLAHYGASKNNNSASLVRKWIIDNIQSANSDNWHTFQWCAVVLIEALKSTNYEGILPNCWVDSWLHFGTQIDINKCQLGDIIIIGDHTKRTHISTFIRYSSDFSTIYCLGGNQNDCIQISNYDIRGVYKVIRFNNL
jgi:hypothetical protein